MPLTVIDTIRVSARRSCMTLGFLLGSQVTLLEGIDMGIDMKKSYSAYSRADLAGYWSERADLNE